jgi:hypothetical protein
MYGAGGNAGGGIYDELDAALPPPPKGGERRGSTRNETYATAPPQNRSTNGGVYDTVGVLAVNRMSAPSSNKPPSIKRALKPGANATPEYATASLADNRRSQGNNATYSTTVPSQQSTYGDADDLGC